MASVNCQDGMQHKTTEFKSNSEKLTEIIHKIHSASQSDKIQRSESTILFNINLEKQQLMLEKHKIEFTSAFDQLEQFISDNPNSKWADDAAFCISLGYIFIISRNRPIFNYNNNYTKQFLLDNSSFEIEKWTKEMLGVYYDFFFSQIKPEIKEKLDEKEIIRGGLYSLLITEYCVDGNFSEAKSELKEISQSVIDIDKYYINNMNDIIKAYQKQANNRE
jgi:hypothetical protein